MAAAAPASSRVRLRAGCLAANTDLAFCWAAATFLSSRAGVLWVPSVWGMGRCGLSAAGLGMASGRGPAETGSCLAEAGAGSGATGAGLECASVAPCTGSSVKSSAAGISRAAVIGGNSLLSPASCDAAACSAGSSASSSSSAPGRSCISGASPDCPKGLRPAASPESGSCGIVCSCLARSAFFSASINKLMALSPPLWLIRARDWVTRRADP